VSRQAVLYPVAYKNTQPEILNAFSSADLVDELLPPDTVPLFVKGRYERPVAQQPAIHARACQFFCV